MSIEMSGCLPLLEIKGSPYEAGLALGRHGAAAAHRHLACTHAWATVTGLRESRFVRQARASVETRFPRYFEELEGLAAGLELAFEDVFAWNCRGDLWTMSPDGCTTIQIPGGRAPGAEPVVAHNEDGDPGLRRGCAVARVEPAGGRAFTAFVYPASLPGHTFAVNDAGLVTTVNNIRSRRAGEGLPRMAVTRAVLDCASVGEAVALIRELPRAGAFHLTLARPGEEDIVSVEFTHSGVSALPVRRASCHANHLVHADIRAEPQAVTASSASRQARGDAMIAAMPGPVDPLAVLRDRTCAALPIHRAQPDDPDHENTLATACFKIGADRVDWAVYDDMNDRPRYRFAGTRPLCA